MIRTVQDLIDVLNRIEDKSLPICVGDRNPIDSVDIECDINMVFIWPDYENLI